MDSLTFYAQTALEEPLSCAGRLYVNDGSWVADTKSDDDGALTFEVDDNARDWSLIVTPFDPGYWTGYFECPDDSSIVVCPAIGEEEIVEPWWIPERITDSPGRGIRIGVIDRRFVAGKGIEHVHGLAPLGMSENPIPHGEAICRILADQRIPSMIPHAEIYFRAADAARDGHLDLASVVVAIMELVTEDQVDLITLSAGVSVPCSPDAADHPLIGLREAIGAARDVGVLCFAAAGNDYDDPVVVPAAFDDCVAVGAIGRVGWGATSSMARRWADTAKAVAEMQCGDRRVPVFHWGPSGRGKFLDVVAPGVGIIVGRAGAPSWDMIGTSFATPVACGALAAALSADPIYGGLPRSLERADHAREVLEAISVPLAIDGRLCGLGCPRG